ncbi:MAG TPA: protein-glutamate O-methyltransferase CheR [Acidimicrobiales bacterium]|nr:protein-glutamate O-methyltransferase CheR [Acidimicrobiales bacterium]
MTVAVPEFQYLRDVLHKHSAIVLADDKQYLVEARLAPIARDLGFDSVEDVVREMRRGDRGLQDRVVEAMTTNETSWFRDVHPFNALRDTILPELIDRNRESRTLSVWSAACSTGQELYSVALLLDAHFSEVEYWNLELLGTDLNNTVVDRARAGSFSGLEINRGLPAAMIARYFVRDGANFVIHARLRNKVRFEKFNLAAQWTGLPTFDLILLRNVLIYFDQPTKKQILDAACRQLAPWGYLAMGGAESPIGITDTLETVAIGGATFYRPEGR